LKTKIGIGKSRASELMQIADGTKTVEKLRADTARRVMKHAKSSPLANGENAVGSTAISPPCGGENCGSRSTALVALSPPDAEDESILDDDGRHAVIDHRKPPAMRLRGFFFRASEAERAAKIDDMRGLRTPEVLQATENAARAWDDLYRDMETSAERECAVDTDATVAPPEVAFENLNFLLARHQAGGKAFRRMIKVTRLEDAARDELRLGVESLISRWKAVLSTLEPHKEG